ncbi:uncharacterized protein LOC119186019 isoform X4 [Rhipicephalus microplus]|uniref:uncharacterized protein LOC119186019 isoform X4 n=1 Tax=Rhipicephalus microplus TaxID=6941 RepID=UPI003F6CE604
MADVLPALRQDAGFALKLCIWCMRWTFPETLLLSRGGLHTTRTLHLLNNLQRLGLPMFAPGTRE